MLVHEAGGQGKADIWSVAQWARDRWPTFPEMSVAGRTVPETSGGMVKAQVNKPEPFSLYSPLPIEEDNSGKGNEGELDFSDAYLATFPEYAGDEL